MSCSGRYTDMNECARTRGLVVVLPSRAAAEMPYPFDGSRYRIGPQHTTANDNRRPAERASSLTDGAVSNDGCSHLLLMHFDRLMYPTSCPSSTLPSRGRGRFLSTWVRAPARPCWRRRAGSPSSRRYCVRSTRAPLLSLVCLLLSV